MPASRAPEQVSQLGDKRRAVEPLVSTRGMLGEGGIFTRSEVGEAGRGLVKTRECALHWRLHLLEAPLCVGANLTPKAPLCVGANHYNCSSMRRRQLRNQGSSTRRRLHPTLSSSMRRRQPRTKSPLNGSFGASANIDENQKTEDPSRLASRGPVLRSNLPFPLSPPWGGGHDLPRSFGCFENRASGASF
jgi:hypothetical protein